MAYRKDWISLIRTLSRQNQLDPAALLAVSAFGEGALGGAVGDNNHAFGPFQANDAGGILTGRPGNHRAFAESPEGIAWQIAQIAQIAKGKRGKAAIEAIVRQFERPQDPDSEIARALAGYGKFVGPQPVPVQGASTMPALPQAGVGGGLPAGPLAHLDPERQQLALSLLTKTSPLAKAGPALTDLLASELTRQPAGVSAQAGAKGAEAPTEGPGKTSMVTVAPTADRHGVPTRPEVIQFVEQIAERYGKSLKIGTGSNHREYVQGRDHVQSDHWTGEAADIPAAGKSLTALGRAALVAAGADPLWAAQQQGGVYNINGYQILFNTNVGGNHFDHLHVGLGRRLGRHS